MREAIDPVVFGEVLGNFVDQARAAVRTHLGWFDKFTGDGFLAYWLYQDEEELMKVARHAVIPGCAYFMHVFMNHHLPAFHENSRNAPSDAGLSLVYNTYFDNFNVTGTSQ